VVITVEQIDYWRSLPSETEVLEFKEAKTQYDNTKLFRYCVALANEGGGHLLLGIRDKLPRPVVSTAAFNDLPGISQLLLATLGFRVDVAETFHPDGRVLTFRIPSRPRGTPLHHNGEYLMRSGEALVSMTPDVLKRICFEGEPDWLEEATVAKIGAARVAELLDISTYFSLIEIAVPQTFDGIIEQLLRDRLIIDEGHGAFSIRRIGALMLAKNLSEFPEIHRKAARVIAYRGTSKHGIPISDRTGVKGYAVGFQLLVKHINDLLPQNEVIQDALRNQIKLVPELVIRELVANALIHQDFNITGMSVAVEVFSNHIEVSNPGKPIISVERLIDSYQSRNERLASLMRKMRICEERGRGIDEVVRMAEIFQLRAPEFRATENRTSVLMFGHRGFSEMDREDRIRACYQHSALRWVMSERMTNQSLRERFGLPVDKSTIVSQIISATIKAGYIKLDADAGASRRLASYLPSWA
jgi:predicted HTH transcriptional regulator